MTAAASNRRIALLLFPIALVRWRATGIGTIAARARDGLCVVALIFALGLSSSAGAVEWPAVGRVNVAGLAFCTGTLIDPQQVVTAAHCLFHPRTGELVSIDRIHFVAGWDRGDFVAHAQPTAVRIAAGYDWHERLMPSGLEHDLAVLEFDRPLDAPSMALMPQADGTGRLSMVHYSRERPHLVFVEEGCLRLRVVGRLWQIDCIVEPGSSGAPVLVIDDDGAGLAAIVVGSTRVGENRTTLALPITAFGMRQSR